MQSKQYFTKIKNYPHEKSTEPMGHTSEKTTRIYLASLSQVVMDEANHKVLSSI